MLRTLLGVIFPSVRSTWYTAITRVRGSITVTNCWPPSAAVTCAIKSPLAADGDKLAVAADAGSQKLRTAVAAITRPAIAKAPSDLCLMHLYPIDGAVQKVAKDATPWGARDARWSMVIAAIDTDPAKADALKKWGRAYWEAVHPYNLDGAYVNFMMDDEIDGRVQATYGPNYKRLTEVKRKYDPNNFFRVNQNIRPA